jgi:UDP-N-acetylmuramate: L-alanyl-gamma-D-glutamyl-meso-diaminopimelate ligase
VFCFGADLGWDARAALAPLGTKALVIDDLERLAQAIAQEARAGDHVVIMSNGGFGGLHQKVLDRLRTK